MPSLANALFDGDVNDSRGVIGQFEELELFLAYIKKIIITKNYR